MPTRRHADPFANWTPEMFRERERISRARATESLLRGDGGEALHFTEAAHWKAAAERRETADA